MLKAFSILWLMVFVPICFLIFSYGYSPVWMIADHVQASIVSDQEKGVFYLLEKELQPIHQNKWQEKIEDISDHFSYQLKLETLTNATSDIAKKQNLINGEFVFIEGIPNILKRRIAGTDWVISKALDMDENEMYIRSVRGGAHLILTQFEQTPKDQWPVLMQELSEQFVFEFTLLNKAELTLDDSQQQALDAQEIVLHPRNDGQFELYRVLPDNETVIQAITPAYGSTQAGMYIALFVTFIASVSVCMFIWVYPVWRDLKRLSKTAEEFGDGNLEKRAKPSKASVVANLSRSFNSMANSIQELIVGQRELTNSIAHDLRTPLYRLKFAFEMLEAKELTAKDRAHYQDCIEVSIEDLDKLIDQTLMLSRYRRITDFNQFSNTLFAQVIDREATLFRLNHPKLTLNIEIDPNLEKALIFVDRAALSRALLNLLTNASRFAQSNIKIQFLESKENYELTVEDDGPGIDPQYWPTLFKPFTQVNNQHRDNTEGHGLGLAIVNQIAQWHKGTVEINRADSGGARFTLLWPKIHAEKKTHSDSATTLSPNVTI